jgi:hypothetical protein
MIGRCCDSPLEVGSVVVQGHLLKWSGPEGGLGVLGVAAVDSTWLEVFSPIGQCGNAGLFQSEWAANLWRGTGLWFEAGCPCRC